MVKPKSRYFIGDMSKICNMSRKTLRYYDEIGLIPSQRHDYNNYRYYTYESLLAVPVIKYYKQMGFSLEEMKEFIKGDSKNVYRRLQRRFQDKISELETEQEMIRRKCVSVKDWHALIQEAETVLENDISEVGSKFVDSSTLLYYDQVFENDIEGSIINLEFTNYIESLGNETTGPVLIRFSSMQDRVENRAQPVKILQKPLMPVKDKHAYHFGGQMMVSCYHLGPHESIHETYRKISCWAREKGYDLAEEVYERYVTDYWTTRNSARYVTEILIKASRKRGGEQAT
ncbi:MerR family transcriptional regulator [Pseudodesulfovibrio cashew]|uniref:MerR family transcriptional regulator n=2 Tax=Pseudodesulfovibrio cashew TaxID=2678688 RepID=A0A6I6JQ04_9BACT|nr:MerR family transcriptional regulator [Pseudodesulfovibrio cashew]